MRYSTSAIINSPQSPLKLATKKKEKERSRYEASSRSHDAAVILNEIHMETTHLMQLADYIYLNLARFRGSTLTLSGQKFRKPRIWNAFQEITTNFSTSPPFLLLSSSSLRSNGVDVFLDLLIGRKGNYVRPFEWSAKRADWLSLLTL